MSYIPPHQTRSPGRDYYQVTSSSNRTWLTMNYMTATGGIAPPVAVMYSPTF
jgi:hypothetical protein